MFRSTVRATNVAPTPSAKAHGLIGPVGRAHRRRLGHLPELAGRRVLALGEPVDPVVEEQDREVHVPPEDVEHVVAADGEAVAVPGHHEDLEVRARQAEAGRDGRRPAVDRVEPVGVHVVREPARAADPGDEDDVLPGDAEVGHHLLDGRQDRVVPAARAPADVLVGLEVLLRVARAPAVRSSRCSSVALDQLVDRVHDFLRWRAARPARG